MKTATALSLFFMAACYASGATYTLIPGSKANWLGKKIGGQHMGTVDFSEGRVEFTDGRLTGGRFSIDMSTISATDVQGSSKKNLDDHLKSDDFFGVSSDEKNRKATFVISRAEKTEGTNYRVTGNLTIKGATHEEVLNASISQDGQGLKGRGKLTFDRTKYGIVYRSGNVFKDLGDKLIHDEVELEFDITATGGGDANNAGAPTPRT